MYQEFFDETALYQWEFKNKGYAHFDSEFCQDRVTELLAVAQNTQHLPHYFYPFIRCKIPKYKRDENKRVYIDVDNPRYIMHTARIDANIYSFYRSVLMNKYEKVLKNLGISDCVIAYRKIPIETDAIHGKCNVHFANEAMKEIKRQINENNECAAIAMDINGFFDSLDHDLIKRQWLRVMGFKKGLPKDHFTIFKNITRFKYIDSKTLERNLRFKFSKLISKQICSPNVFREKVLPYLSEENKLGIPQGTTISDVIANMYMLDFDILMKKFADKYQGYYRRYSDDILMICPPNYQEKAEKFISWLIKKTGKTLSISHKKTLISFFKKAETGVQCVSYKSNNGNYKLINKPFEYLGLSFDGKDTSIRVSTISAFYSKLSERIKKEVAIAYQKLVYKSISYPKETEIYKIINFDMIRNNYMRNLNKKNVHDIFERNFYTYVQLIAKITGNKDVLKMFNTLGKWIKNRGKEYCTIAVTKRIVKKH